MEDKVDLVGLNPKIDEPVFHVSLLHNDGVGPVVRLVALGPVKLVAVEFVHGNHGADRDA